MHGQTSDFVAVRNRSFDRIAERNLLPSELELLTNLRTKSDVAVLDSNSGSHPDLANLDSQLPNNRFESLLTLLWTDGHIVHHNLNIQHPVTNSRGFAILPNENRAFHLLMDFLHCVCDLTWDGLAFEAML